MKTHEERSTTAALLSAAVLVLVLGCGGNDEGGDTPAPGPDQEIQIRLVGENHDDFTAVLVTVAGVTATADGQSLPVKLGVGSIDLAATDHAPAHEPDHAWLLGRVRVPESATDVRFTVRFDDAGGYEALRVRGAVDARSLEMSWTATPQSLRRSGRTVLHLNLAGSLVPVGPETLRLVPDVTVQD